MKWFDAEANGNDDQFFSFRLNELRHVVKFQEYFAIKNIYSSQLVRSKEKLKKLDFRIS